MPTPVIEIDGAGTNGPLPDRRRPVNAAPTFCETDYANQYPGLEWDDTPEPSGVAGTDADLDAVIEQRNFFGSDFDC